MANRHNIVEANLDTRAPITENCDVHLDGIMSATLSNAGDTVVTLNHHLTMKPGATLQLFVPHPSVVFNVKLYISFAAGGVGEENRLEIMESRLAHIDYNNFTRDDPADTTLRLRS